MDGSSAMPGGDDDGSIARVAGNRAGIVEWANDAFSRLTGIALAEIVDKPVTRFLERAGIEVEVVDFVAQHFFEGRPCRLELPFERPDGRHIEVLLEVEPLRDAEGEIDRFDAKAWEQVPPSPNGPVPSDHSLRVADPTASATPVAAEAPRARVFPPESGSTAAPRAIPLAPTIRRIAAAELRDERKGLRDAESWLLDLDLAEEPLAIRAGEADLEALIVDLLEAARAALAHTGQAWGTITLSTGRTVPRRRFRSKVHAIPAYPPELAGPSRVHLEVHDTGEPLAQRAIDRLLGRDAKPAAAGPVRDAMEAVDRREAALGRALNRARALGATVHLDGTPGCGNQVLVLFPA